MTRRRPGAWLLHVLVSVLIFSILSSPATSRAQPVTDPLGTGSGSGAAANASPATPEVAEALVGVHALLADQPLEVGVRRYEMVLDTEASVLITREIIPLAVRGDEPVAVANFHLSDKVSEVQLSDLGGAHQVEMTVLLERSHLRAPIRVVQLRFTPPLDPDTPIELAVDARLTMELGNPLWRIAGGEAQLIWVQSLLSESVPWEPSGDNLPLRWNFALSVRAPQASTVISNTEVATEIIETPCAPLPALAACRVVEFEPTPAPTYLTLRIGDLVASRVDAVEGGVPVEIWTPPDLELGEGVIDAIGGLVAPAVALYTDWFGALPIEVFRVVHYDNTFFGQDLTGARGMTGQMWLPPTFLTVPLGEPWERGELRLRKDRMVLHELAHSWWIGWVNFYGPADLFLTEGVCNWSAVQAAEAILGEDIAVELLQEYRQNWLRYADREAPLTEIHLVRNPELRALPYHRGGLSLFAMQEYFGADPIRAVFRELTESHYQTELSLEDFEAVLTLHLGAEGQVFIDQLIRAPGIAHYDVVVDASEPGVLQVTATNSGTARVPAPLWVGDDVTMLTLEPGEAMEIRVPYVGEAAASDVEISVDPEGIRLVDAVITWLP